MVEACRESVLIPSHNTVVVDDPLSLVGFLDLLNVPSHKAITVTHEQNTRWSQSRKAEAEAKAKIELFFTT
ncbi:MAG: hypothetical protein J07HQW1_01503 [Haloquadratum walsbyi J07HQW1]|uniref:Uncharacterized protein n=1 Tax=Haloquadratum walsbyi J07HQW1 TaxID=1238424 RepID=U1MNN8_9EURY|nr:MAG: hypothetical protein J07HQW1_01503 [Haloquadratum walsbyi J07HQW1]